MSKNLIHKSFAGSKKILFLVTFIAMFCVAIVTVLMSVYNTGISNNISTAKQLYGKSSYSIKMFDDEDEKKIKESDNTLSVYETYECDYNDDGSLQRFHYVKGEDFFDYTEFEISEGRMPQNEDEVLVEKWYMVNNGVETDNIIGSEVELYNYETEKKEKKKVVGIMKKNEWWLLSNMEKRTANFVMLLNDNDIKTGNIKYNRIYVENKDVKESKIFSENLIKTSENGCIEAEYNDALLSYSGVSGEIVDNSVISKTFYYTIITISMIFIAFTVYNAVSVCLYNWRKNISFYYFVGMNGTYMWFNIYKIIINYVLAGGITGAAGGVLISKTITIVSYINTSFGVEHSNVIVDYWGVAKCMLLIIVVSILAISVNIIKLINNTPYNVKQKLDSVNKKNSMRERYLTLFKSDFCPVFKYTVRNITTKFFRSVFLIGIVAVTVVLFMYSGMQVKNSKDYSDNNYKYRYYFQVDGVFDVSEEKYDEVHKLEKELTDICKKYNLVQYFMNSSDSEDVEIPKTYISDEYRKYLSNQAKYVRKIDDENSYINENVLILEYTDDMLKSLYARMGKEYTELENNQCLVFNRVCDLSGTGTYSLLPKIGDSMTVNTHMSDCMSFEEVEEHVNEYIGLRRALNLQITGTVDELLVYPELQNKNEKPICIIINEDTYERYYNYGWMKGSFYIENIDEDALSEIKSVTDGLSYVDIVDKKEQLQTQKDSATQKVLVYKIVFVIVSVCAILNIIMVNLLNINAKKFNIAMLKVMGVSENIINCCNALETFIIFVTGSIIGYLYARSKMLEMYDMEGMLINTVTKKYLMLSVVLIALSMILTMIISKIKIKSIRIPKDLRE